MQRADYLSKAWSDNCYCRSLLAIAFYCRKREGKILNRSQYFPDDRVSGGNNTAVVHQYDISTAVVQRWKKGKSEQNVKRPAERGHFTAICF